MYIKEIYAYSFEGEKIIQYEKMFDETNDTTAARRQRNSFDRSTIEFQRQQEESTADIFEAPTRRPEREYQNSDLNADTQRRQPAGLNSDLFNQPTERLRDIPSARSPVLPPEPPSPPYLITRLSGITALPHSQLLTEFFAQRRRDLRENLFRILICAFAFCPIQPGETLSSAMFRHFSYAIDPEDDENTRYGWLSQSKEALDELHRMLLAREGLLEQDQNGYTKLTPQLIETIRETLLKNRHGQYEENCYLNIAVLFEAFSDLMNPDMLAKAAEKIRRVYNRWMYGCLPEVVASGESNQDDRRHIRLDLYNPDDQRLKAFLISYRISSRSSNVQRHPSVVLGNNPFEALIPEYRQAIERTEREIRREMWQRNNLPDATTRNETTRLQVQNAMDHNPSQNPEQNVQPQYPSQNFTISAQEEPSRAIRPEVSVSQYKNILSKKVLDGLLVGFISLGLLAAVFGLMEVAMAFSVLITLACISSYLMDKQQPVYNNIEVSS